MPRIIKSPKLDVDANHEELVNGILNEFHAETPGKFLTDWRGIDTPVILEQQMVRSERLRVYVVWERWRGVREDHRTNAIIGAYERKLGPAYAGRIVIALGLTVDEAYELGLKP